MIEKYEKPVVVYEQIGDSCHRGSLLSDAS